MGLRFDITLFVIRFDVGISLAQTLGTESMGWQRQDPDVGWAVEKAVENVIYNLGIGYPSLIFFEYRIKNKELRRDEAVLFVSSLVQYS